MGIWFLINLTHQMECFIYPWDIFQMSIWGGGRGGVVDPKHLDKKNSFSFRTRCSSLAKRTFLQTSVFDSRKIAKSKMPLISTNSFSSKNTDWSCLISRLAKNKPDVRFSKWILRFQKQSSSKFGCYWVTAEMVGAEQCDWRFLMFCLTDFCLGRGGSTSLNNANQ